MAEESFLVIVEKVSVRFNVFERGLMLTAFIWLKVVKQQHCEIILQFKNINFHFF